MMMPRGSAALVYVPSRPPAPRRRFQQVLCPGQRGGGGGGSIVGAEQQVPDDGEVVPLLAALGSQPVHGSSCACGATAGERGHQRTTEAAGVAATAAAVAGRRARPAGVRVRPGKVANAASPTTVGLGGAHPTRVSRRLDAVEDPRRQRLREGPLAAASPRAAPGTDAVPAQLLAGAAGYAPAATTTATAAAAVAVAAAANQGSRWRGRMG